MHRCAKISRGSRTLGCPCSNYFLRLQVSTGLTVNLVSIILFAKNSFGSLHHNNWELRKTSLPSAVEMQNLRLKKNQFNFLKHFFELSDCDDDDGGGDSKRRCKWGRASDSWQIVGPTSIYCFLSKMGPFFIMLPY